MGLVLLLHRIRDPGVVARVKVAQQRVLQQWDQRRPQRLVRVRARVNPNQRGPQHQAVEAVPCDRSRATHKGAHDDLVRG